MPSQSHADQVISDLKNGVAVVPRSNKRNVLGIEGITVYTNLARWIPLAIDPFIDIGFVLVAGMEQSENCDDETLRLYDLIVTIQPKLEEVLEALVDQTNHFQQFTKHLEATVNSAKTDDTSSLKPVIGRYLKENPDDTAAVPEVKSARGFRNKFTARALCPVKRLEEFDADSELFMNGISEGKEDYIIKAGEWPTFLYDTNIIDLADPLKGFMRSNFLVRVYRHIFTGPSSSMSGTRNATKPAKAHIHGLKKVTGRTIAYAAIQARFALSSCEKWSVKDGKFNLQHFFNNIVTVFEADPKNPWVVETLEWWNKQLPDLTPTLKKNRRRRATEEQDSSDDGGALEILSCLKAQQPNSDNATVQSLGCHESDDDDDKSQDQPEDGGENDTSSDEHVEHESSSPARNDSVHRSPLKDIQPQTRPSQIIHSVDRHSIRRSKHQRHPQSSPASRNCDPTPSSSNSSPAPRRVPPAASKHRRLEKSGRQVNNSDSDDDHRRVNPSTARNDPPKLRLKRLSRHDDSETSSKKKKKKN